MSSAMTTVDGLDESHYMLLHMVYLYSEAARGDNRWVRETPLLVLMYEGICEEIFDYDYAPASVKVGRRRVYMNVTQEGRDDLDDLREAGLLLSLKLTNNLNNNLTAFRLSDLGLHMLLDSGRVSRSLKTRVEDFLRLAPGPQGLKRVRWTGEAFEMYCPATGYSALSEVTECEDVSYVTSPYVPPCMRECQFPENKSNTSRAGEAGEGESNIKDELDEAIVISGITLLVGEWIPFGSNQVVALNDRLGSGERCQGGFLTALTDDTPDSMHYQQADDVDLTEVQLLDFSPETYVNFEAEVHFPEDEGIVQIENIGVHVDHHGNVAFGKKHSTSVPPPPANGLAAACWHPRLTHASTHRRAYPSCLPLTFGVAIACSCHRRGAAGGGARPRAKPNLVGSAQPRDGRPPAGLLQAHRLPRRGAPARAARHRLLRRQGEPRQVHADPRRVDRAEDARRKISRQGGLRERAQAGAALSRPFSEPHCCLLKIIILPRQARDKRRETSKTRDRFLAGAW